MNNSKTPQTPETPRFPDISRYTRWVNEMQEKEQLLSPRKRKYKWLIVMTVLFLLFLSSFFLFPGPGISHQPVSPLPATGETDADTLKKKMSRTFDMPVDSFEQYLKKDLHEKLPE